MMKVVRQALFEEVFSYKRKRKEVLCLENLFNHSIRWHLQAWGRPQGPEDIWRLAPFFIELA
jgi:hypothetical protein